MQKLVRTPEVMIAQEYWNVRGSGAVDLIPACRLCVAPELIFAQSYAAYPRPLQIANSPERTFHPRYPTLTMMRLRLHAVAIRQVGLK